MGGGGRAAGMWGGPRMKIRWAGPVVPRRFCQFPGQGLLFAGQNPDQQTCRQNLTDADKAPVCFFKYSTWWVFSALYPAVPGSSQVCHALPYGRLPQTATGCTCFPPSSFCIYRLKCSKAIQGHPERMTKVKRFAPALIFRSRISDKFILQSHIGVQCSLVTNLVTKSVTNLVTNLVITKQGDKFVTKFVTKFGVHQIW